MKTCIFCNVASGAIPASIVLETDSVIAFKDIMPQAPIHVLVIPKEHRQSLMACSEDGLLLAELLKVVQEVALILGVDKTGFRVVTNIGTDGGQSVDHLHFHILAGRQMTWPPG